MFFICSLFFLKEKQENRQNWWLILSVTKKVSMEYERKQRLQMEKKHRII